MILEYKGFEIKIIGIREFTIKIIINNKLVLERSRNCCDFIINGGFLLPITKEVDAINISKEIIDRHEDKLMERFFTGKTRSVKTESRNIKLNASKNKVSTAKIDRSMYGF